MHDCIFCKIIQGIIPAFRLYEDAHTLAFLDIFPGAEGHALVVPKVHAENIFEIQEESLSHTIVAAKKVAASMRDVLGFDGLNLFQSNGTAAFQSVFHLHIHLLPRKQGDDLKLPWTPRKTESNTLEHTAALIRAHLCST